MISPSLQQQCHDDDDDDSSSHTTTHVPLQIECSVTAATDSSEMETALSPPCLRRRQRSLSFSDCATSPLRSEFLRRQALHEDLSESFHTTPAAPPPRTLQRSYSDYAIRSSPAAAISSQPLRPKALFRSRTTRERRWLIPAEHPLKLCWDVLTLVLSILNAYATHISIRDRHFGTQISRLSQIWFAIDVVLNFVTEYKTGAGVVLKRPTRVWARYCTTWFVIDALSLFPGELVYLKPLIEQQNSRGWFQKLPRRAQAVVRFTRVLRGRHVRWFGLAAKQTKRAGMGGANRLLIRLIKYLPKYWMFLRNMKAVVVLRMLRQVHFVRRLWLPTVETLKKEEHEDAWDDHTFSLTEAEDSIAAEDWEYFEDDDPF
jgi:hypothetical protein